MELFRLIRHFGSLKFDELMFFGLQLVDYRKFDEIIQKINDFRTAKAQNEGNYKKFRKDFLDKELRIIYQEDIISGNTKKRNKRHVYFKISKNKGK